MFVLKAVNGRAQGVWAFQLEKSFLDENFARLPTDWITIVKNSDVLRVEKLGDNSFIIRPKNLNQVIIFWSCFKGDGQYNIIL